MKKIKRPEQQVTTVTLNKSAHDALRYISTGKDIKFNDTFREAVREYIKRNEKYLPEAIKKEV